jgi:hypothetical protein
MGVSADPGRAHGAHRIRATRERERGIWVLFHVQIRA